MRLDWLDDLVAIIENDSLSEAAAARLLTQPAFSRRIKAIEDLLDAPLLDRSRRPARPSFLLLEQEHRVRELSARMRELTSDLRRDARRKSNRIVVASQHAITTAFAPQAVRSLAARARVSVRLRSVNREECYALLFTRQADLILTYRMADEPPHPMLNFTETLEIGHDCLVPVFRTDRLSRLAGSGTDTDLPVIAYPLDVFLGDIFHTRIISRIEPQRNVWPVVETALTNAARELAIEGVGLAWVPESLVLEDIARRRLTDLRGTYPWVTMQRIATRRAEAKSKVETEIWEILRRGQDTTDGP